MFANLLDPCNCIDDCVGKFLINCICIHAFFKEIVSVTLKNKNIIIVIACSFSMAMVYKVADVIFLSVYHYRRKTEE